MVFIRTDPHVTSLLLLAVVPLSAQRVQHASAFGETFAGVFSASLQVRGGWPPTTPSGVWWLLIAAFFAAATSLRSASCPGT